MNSPRSLDWEHAGTYAFVIALIIKVYLRKSQNFKIKNNQGNQTTFVLERERERKRPINLENGITFLLVCFCFICFI